MGKMSQMYADDMWENNYFSLLKDFNKFENDSCVLYHMKKDIKNIEYQINQLHKTILIFKENYKEELES